MSDTKFTPGPWRISKSNRTRIVGPDDRVIAVAWHIPTKKKDRTGRLASIEKANATAAFLCAAPDMYEALKLVMQHGRIDDSEHRMNVVASAIAKAEGRS